MPTRTTNPDGKIEKIRDFLKDKKFKLFRKTTAVVVVIGVGLSWAAYDIRNLFKENYEEEPTSIVTTAPDVNNDNDFIDDSTTEPSIEPETDEEELKSIIDQILKVEFQPTDTYFQNYDITSSVLEDLNALNNPNASETNLEEASYDWYQNGIIDSDKLYEKIIANSKASGIEITTNVEEITKAFTKEVQGCLDYIKQQTPNFNSNAALRNIDTLIMYDAADKSYMSRYDPDKNHIEIDYQYSVENNLLEYNIDYSMFQLLANKGKNLYWNFISQRFNEDFIMDYENRNIDNYKDEGYKVEMLAAATGKSSEEFSNYYLNGDIEFIASAFEPEMPKEYVFSILQALDMACGYGDIPDGCDEEKFRNNASAYGKLGLIHNIYIRKMKGIYISGKSIDEAEKEINDVKKQILNDKYSKLSMDSQTDDQLDECIDQLNKIFYSMKYSK